MMPSHDKNGLELSSKSSSGYRFVTTFFEGTLAGKFIAFADVKEEGLQAQNLEHEKRITGFFGFKNVVALGIFDDVRAAAFVGQNFYGSNADNRDMNLEALFNGDDSVVPVPPAAWDHEPDHDRMAGAKKRVARRANVDVQEALAAFYKEHGTGYNVKSTDAKDIRATMNAYLGTLDMPKQSDAAEAARIAFEPFKK